MTDTTVTTETPDPAAQTTQTQTDPKTTNDADWRDKQIDRQHRLLKDRDRQLADALAENERLKTLADKAMTPPTTTPAQTPQTTPPATKSFDEAEVERRANEKFDTNRYNTECNEAFAKGQAEYGDKWEPTLKRLSQFPDFASNRSIMNDILATDNPAQVLWELGSKPENTQRLLDLAPAKRRTEFVKMALKPSTPKPEISKVPAPQEGIDGAGQTTNNGRGDIYDDKMSDDEWYAIRQKQKEARFRARQGR